MNRLITFAVLLLATISVAAEVHPISIARPTQFQEDLIVPGYNTANGPMTTLSICYRYKHKRRIVGESTDMQPSFVSVAFDSGWLELRTENDVIAHIPFPAEQEGYNLTDYDGTTDFAGPSGFKFRSVRNGHGIVYISDPAIVQRFKDVPTVAITAQGYDLFSASGAGNLDMISKSKIVVIGEVVYFN